MLLESAASAWRRIRSRVEPFTGLVRALPLAGAYALFTLFARMVVLTVVTYFLVNAHQGLRLEDISDVFGSNEILVSGFTALCFVAVARRLGPVGAAGRSAPMFTPALFEARFIPGFLRGSILAWAMALAFLVTGYYRYLGFYIQFEESFQALANVAARILALGLMAYCEEWLFRKQLLDYARRHLPIPAAAAIAAVAFCAVKALQFDLGLMHLTTLFLFALGAGLRSAQGGDFLYGAGFLAALLIVFHPLLGLPVFGNSFPGVLMIKVQGMEDLAAGAQFRLLPDGTDARTLVFLTGGVGGPLSSFALQFVLLIQAALSWLKLARPR
ncbi:MAG: hypothetical protein IT285_07045 [Bdellovibrionales bacterium]|nr:hypothetical protein [Bdellovibrionales bacterium]